MYQRCSVLLLCLGTLIAAAGRAPADDKLISDGIQLAFGSGTIEDQGYSWRVPDAPPVGDGNQPAENQWDRPFPKSFPARFGPLYSGLSKSQDGTKLIFPIAGSQPKERGIDFTKADASLLDQGYNIRKFNRMTAADFKRVVDLQVQYTSRPAADRPALLASARTNTGLVAIPDAAVMQAASRLYTARMAGEKNVRDGNAQDAADAKLLCEYFATNQEMSIYRNIVVDPKIVAQRAKLGALIQEKRSYDLTDANIKRETSNLMAVMGIDGLKGLGTKSFPTSDELRGLDNWANYFANRENPKATQIKDLNGRTVSVTGEQAVGGYLDSKATRCAADLLRYDGTNARPLPMTPPEVKDETDRGYAEQPNTPPHTWKDAAASVIKSYREDREKAEDRIGRERKLK